MIMNTVNKTDKQLRGKDLYSKQKLAENYSDNIKIIALDIQTPENLASIFRLADAAGCKTIVLVGDKNSHDTRKVSKIARAVEKFLTIEKMSREEFIKEHKKFQPLMAVDITARSKNLFSVSLPEECAFVIGNEKYGVDAEILDLCDQAIHIPMFGCNGSMNVSHALGIVLFEWRRQMSLKTSTVVSQGSDVSD